MGNSYNPRIVTNGLVLYLDAANPKSYPGSGTTWKDLSGNGNDGTIINNPTFNNIPDTLAFDGSNDYVTVNNLGLSDHTMDGWINSFQSSGGTGANVAVILGNYGHIGGVDGNKKYTFVGIEGSTLDWRIDNSNNSFRLIASSNFQTNEWYHVALTYNSNGIAAAYLDGVPIGSINAGSNILFNDMPFNVARQDENDRYFSGLVSNTKIYNRALTEAEIKQNYNALKGRYGL